MLQGSGKKFTPKNPCKLLKNGGGRRKVGEIHPKRENTL
jgi:hypothetical protein